MAVTHSATVRNLVAALVVGRVDLGTGVAAGKLLFKSTTPATLASITLANPAFTVSGAVATLAGVPLTSGPGAIGTVATCDFVDRDAVVVMSCAVSTSGADINLSGLTLALNDTITITGLTYTSPL